MIAALFPRRTASCRRRGARLAQALATCVLWLVATGSALQATDDLQPAGPGPLRLASLSPLAWVRLGFLHQEPELPGAGNATGFLALTWANHWDFTEKYVVATDSWYRIVLFDGESVLLNPFAEVGLTRRLAVSARVPFVYTGGGAMDRTIEQVHGVLGLSDAQRPRFPRDTLRMDIYRGEVPTPLWPEEGPGVRAVPPVASIRYALREGPDPWPLTLKASVNLPRYGERNSLYDRSGHDWALGLATRTRPRSGLTAIGSVAYVHLRRGRLVREDDLVTEHLSLLLALGGWIDPDHGWSVQVQHATNAARGTGTGFDRDTSEFAVGWHGRLGPHLTLELAVYENILNQGNAADVALHAALNARL